MRNFLTKLKEKCFDEDRSIKGFPEHWQQFGICVVCHLVLPLVPLGLEFYVVTYLKTSSIALAASMYVLAIGFSSTNKLECFVDVAIGIVFMFMVGHHLGVEAQLKTIELGMWNNSKSFIVIFMVISFAIHLMTRYNRHIVGRAPFLEFISKEVK